MATISADSQLTPAERRRAVLNKSGKAQASRLATDVPSKVYYGIVGVITVLVVFGLIMVLDLRGTCFANNLPGRCVVSSHFSSPTECRITSGTNG